MNGTAEPERVRRLADCNPFTLPEEVFASPEPVLLSGLVGNWPAVENCGSRAEAATYLARFWSDKPVTVFVGDKQMNGRFGYKDDFTGFNFRAGKSSLPEVLARLGDPPPEHAHIYVGSSSTRVFLPGFSEENQLRVPGEDAQVSIWLGNRTRISAHYDFPDNLACVVSGRRKFTLFPPEQLKNLYVGPLDRNPAGQAISLVDFAAPDLARFPKFREALAAARVAELAPGDALFIPGMWWHHVEALDDFNILINYWWTNTPGFMGSPMDALLHGLLALRDLSPRQRAVWRDLFEHYVFGADEHVYRHIPQRARGCLTAPLTDREARRLRAELLNRLNQ